MQLLSIGALEDIEIIYDKLKSNVDFLEDRGIKLIISRSDISNVKFLNCSIGKNTRVSVDTLNLIRFYIANIISDVIVSHQERKLVNKLINKYYNYLSLEDKNRLFDKAVKNLQREGNRESLNILDKSDIFFYIYDFLKTNDIFILEGFITFRLKEYIKQLCDVVDKSVDELIMEKEYDEFIKLLKYFVDVQEPKIDTIHLIFEDKDKYTILDDRKKSLEKDIFYDLNFEIIEGELTCDDILISTLISIAPQRIYLHNCSIYNNAEIIETIKNVFGDKVKICSGCEICSSKVKVKKE